MKYRMAVTNAIGIPSSFDLYSRMVMRTRGRLPLKPKKISSRNTKNISHCIIFGCTTTTPMNTTRTIRIATGIKKIELGNENMVTFQITDVLKQHRDTLINSLLTDLTTYITYHFRTPPKKEQLDQIRARLLDLRNSAVGLAKYGFLVEEILANDTTYVRSEPFYHEINEVIGEQLNPSQLILVK